MTVLPAGLFLVKPKAEQVHRALLHPEQFGVFMFWRHCLARFTLGSNTPYSNTFVTKNYCLCVELRRASRQVGQSREQVVISQHLFEQWL